MNAGYKINKFFTFLLKRSLRIDPAYYLAIIFTIILFKYFAAVSPVKEAGFPIIPAQLIAHLIYIIPFTKYNFYLHVFWTLGIEFQFYLLIGLFYFLNDTPIYRLLFLCLFTLSSLISWPNSEYVVFTYAPIFTTGIALVALREKKTWLNASGFVFFLAFVSYKLGLIIFLLLSTSCLIVLFFKSTVRLLTFLGDVSYSLYLTHTLTLWVLLRVFSRLHIDVNNVPFFWLSVEVSIAIFCSYIFFRLIEKPSLLLSKYFFYKNQD